MSRNGTKGALLSRSHPGHGAASLVYWGLILPAWRRFEHMSMPRSRPILTLFVAFLFACTPLGDGGSSISRGDQAFAHGDLEEALAEYRLAERQGATDPETLARIAHTYVALKRIDEGREYYRLAVTRDEGYADQAVADFVHLARLREVRSPRSRGITSSTPRMLPRSP